MIRELVATSHDLKLPGSGFFAVDESLVIFGHSLPQHNENHPPSAASNAPLESSQSISPFWAAVVSPPSPNASLTRTQIPWDGTRPAQMYPGWPNTQQSPRFAGK